jgi:3-hydroxyacyl-[acyl-carrier-protein] dehydratase
LEHVEPGKSAIGIKTFSRADLLFMDHFPGNPLVPGVLEIEMIAQTAAKAAKLARPDAMLLLSNVRSARFLKPIKPGDQCRIVAEISKLRTSYMCVAGYVEVNGSRAGEAELVCAIVPRTASASTDEVIEDWLQTRGSRHERHSMEEFSASCAEPSPAVSLL